MTEEEAKTKWCPHFRVKHYTTAAAIPDNTLDAECCIASDCMMWTWNTCHANTDMTNNGFISPIYETSDTEGHCGLAK